MNTLRKIWSGHTASVLATDISMDGLLSSVGEDGRCILWSLDGEKISDICVNAVDCVKATACRDSSDDNPLNSVKFTPNDPNKFFISSGKIILGFDVRKSSSPFTKFEYNKDEINQLCVNDHGEYMAACDDDGEIKVIDLRQSRLYKTLSRRHTNICSSVQFRHQKPWQILSTGLDCNIINWDFSSGKTRQIFNVNSLIKDQSTQELFINPPFVHCIAVAKDAQQFAVGLGNGEIGIFNFQGKNFHCCKTFKAHDAEVSQVHYFDKKNSDPWLISGGNDGKINIWDERKVGEEKSFLHQINNGSKINWITCWSLSKEFVFVADQSSSVIVYEIH